MLGAYEWVWGVIGFCFPVISIFIVAVAGAQTQPRRPSRHGLQPGSYPYGPYPSPPPPPPLPPPRECPWCGSMIEHDVDVCPNCAGRQNQ